MTIESPTFPDPTSNSATVSPVYESQGGYDYNSQSMTSPSLVYYDSGMLPRSRAGTGGGFLTIVGLFIFSLSFLFYYATMMIVLQSIGIGLCCVGGVIGLTNYLRTRSQQRYPDFDYDDEPSAGTSYPPPPNSVYAV